MNGLERMDKPRRGPWAVAGVLGVVVVLVAVWFYLHHKQNANETAVTAAESIAPVVPMLEKDTAETAVTTAESVTPVSAPGVVVASTESVSAVITGATAAAILADADILLAANKKELAREKYFEALAAKPDEALRATLEDKLGKLNIEMIRLPWPMEEKIDYVVQENDAIKFIARKLGTTVEMIVKGNELKRPDMIQPGQRLKVFTGKMEMVVSKSQHDLLLSANGRFFKRYRVATGRYEKTPVGTFSITDRIIEPPWHRDDGEIIPFGDKENILGTRWMAIKATGSTPELNGYGIHGTWDNASIGKSESAGCIRLRNEDVEEIFEMVPIGVTVTIQE